MTDASARDYLCLTLAACRKSLAAVDGRGIPVGDAVPRSNAPSIPSGPAKAGHYVPVEVPAENDPGGKAELQSWVTPDAVDRTQRLSEPEAAAVIAVARAERVDAVLAQCLRQIDSTDVWPPAARAALVEHLRQHLVLESMKQRELVRVLAAFDAAGIEVLLLKGSGLAYTVYAEPHLRPRDDTDLFLRIGDLDRAADTLAGCGYARVDEPNAELASTQRHYIARDGAGLQHIVDLHWRIAIPRVFADAMAFDEIWSRAFAVPSLGVSARTCGVADALLLACVHRVAHHRDAPDLLWLWDIHLLAERVRRDALTIFVAAAARARMCRVCGRGLELAHEHFGTEVDDMVTALDRARSGVEEVSARFVGGLRTIDVLRTDLQTLRWRGRWRLLREHLLPPAEHMRARYGADAFLPLAYIRRIVRGAPPWFKRPRSKKTYAGRG